MSVAAWDGFLNDQSNWPAASRIGNATGATTARDTLGDKTFVKRKRMSQEERHLQILQAAVKIIATKGFWGMSLQNISDELGITEAALYHYISSKDDLLNMVLSECYDTIDADEYNAVTAAIVDADGHRVDRPSDQPTRHPVAGGQGEVGCADQSAHQRMVPRALASAIDCGVAPGSPSAMGTTATAVP